MAAPAAKAAVVLQDAPIVSPAKAKKAEQKLDRKGKRLEKRMERWNKRLQKRKTKEGNSGKRTLGLVLGSILFLGGLALGTLAFGSALGGFFIFFSGLLLVGGIILLLFALLKKPDNSEG